jgi:hypothetical protein
VTGDIAPDSEQIIRRAYKIAEDKDIEGWIAAFTEDGVFIDQSIGVAYQGLTSCRPRSRITLARSPTCTASSTRCT